MPRAELSLMSGCGWWKLVTNCSNFSFILMLHPRHSWYSQNSHTNPVILLGRKICRNGILLTCLMAIAFLNAFLIAFANTTASSPNIFHLGEWVVVLGFHLLLQRDQVKNWDPSFAALWKIIPFNICVRYSLYLLEVFCMRIEVQFSFWSRVQCWSRKQNQNYRIWAEWW